MIDGHHDSVAAGREPASLVEWIGDAAVRIGAAMDIDHHRLADGGVRIGRPDIEEQAVLGLRLIALVRLWADRSELAGLNDLARLSRSDRRHETRCSAVADALEGQDAA